MTVINARLLQKKNFIIDISIFFLYNYVIGVSQALTRKVIF